MARHVGESVELDWEVLLTEEDDCVAYTRLDEDDSAVLALNRAPAGLPRSQLYFIIAHEAGHHVLGHFEDDAVEDYAFSAAAGAATGGIVAGPAGAAIGVLGALVGAAIRRSLTEGAHSREQELAADSFAALWCLERNIPLAQAMY
ncbi:MAG: hypothetical protein D6815_09665, partial [Candidatus Dadabacteria bacterium]